VSDGDPDHRRRLERMYTEAPCNRPYTDVEGDAIEVGDGVATLRLPVRETDFHSAGGLHGHVYFKALDDAAFFAANSVVDDVFLLTTDFHLHLLRPVGDGDGPVRAEGELVNDNPRQLIAEAVAYDADDRQIARGTGTFARSSTELNPEINYE